MLCDQSLPAERISKIISDAGREMIRGIEVIDVYEGKQIPHGKKGLSYNIKYGLDMRTLTEEEIERAHSKVKEALVKKLDITFR